VVCPDFGEDARDWRFSGGTEGSEVWSRGWAGHYGTVFWGGFGVGKSAVEHADEEFMVKQQTATGLAGEVCSAEHARRHPRHTLVATAALWRSEEPDDSVGVPVFITNISMNGMAFRARESFEAGAVHYIRLAVGPLKMESPIRIAWSRPHDATTFDTGAEFATGL